MNGWEIAILVVVCAAFVAAVTYIIYRKVKHKGMGCDCGGSCGGSCAGCPHCAPAPQKSDDERNRQ